MEELQWMGLRALGRGLGVWQESRRRRRRRLCHGRTRNFTEISRSECRRISHGLTRNFTEKTEAETRNEEKAEAEERLDLRIREGDDGAR
jgi:hypothetical protein